MKEDLVVVGTCNDDGLCRMLLSVIDGRLSRYPFGERMQAMPPSISQCVNTVPDRLTVWRASTPGRPFSHARPGHRLLLHFPNRRAHRRGLHRRGHERTVEPLDPFFTFLGGICLSPFLLLFFSSDGQNSPIPCRLTRPTRSPCMRSPAAWWSIPSQPTSSTTSSGRPLRCHGRSLWMLFVFGVGVSTVCLLPLTITGPMH